MADENPYAQFAQPQSGEPSYVVFVSQSGEIPLDYVWPIDREMVDAPAEFAPNAASFFVADQPIVHLLRPPGRIAEWTWRQPRRNKRVFTHRDEQFRFAIHGYGGYGSMYWRVERSRLVGARGVELLTLGSAPLFFRSLWVAEQITQFCSLEPIEGLCWMPAVVH